MTKSHIFLWVTGLILAGLLGAVIVFLIMRQDSMSARQESLAQQAEIDTLNSEITRLENQPEKTSVTTVTTESQKSDEEAITEYLTAKCHGGGATGVPTLLDIRIENNFASVSVNCEGTGGYIQWMKKTDDVWFETFAGQNAPTQTDLDLWDFPRSDNLGTSAPRLE
jgi:hypothetical protein